MEGEDIYTEKESKYRQLSLEEWSKGNAWPSEEDDSYSPEKEGEEEDKVTTEHTDSKPSGSRAHPYDRRQNSLPDDLKVDFEELLKDGEQLKLESNSGVRCKISSITKYCIHECKKRSPKFSDRINYHLEIRYSNGLLLEYKTRKQIRKFTLNSPEVYNYLTD